MLSCYDDETLAELADETPLGRIGVPFDIASAVKFLASHNSDFITGEKKIQTRYCFSVAMLTWDKKEQSFDFESVGLRYLQHRVDGLEDYILKFCKEMKKELDEEL